MGRRPQGGARYDRRPSHPPGTAPPVTQGIPAAAPGKTAHGTGRGASNDGQTILWSITTDRKRILTWSFVWSYGDSNSRPLACHADPVSRFTSEGVERGATHLQELSDWVGISLRVPEYAGSRFWLPCLAVHDHGETVSTYPGALLGSSPARPWPPAAASRRSPATRNYRRARHARRGQHPRLKTRPARRPDPRVSAGRVR